MTTGTPTKTRTMASRADRLELAVEATRNAVAAVNWNYCPMGRNVIREAYRLEAWPLGARDEFEGLWRTADPLNGDAAPLGEEFAAVSPLVPTFQEGFGRGLPTAFYQGLFDEAYDWYQDQLSGLGTYVDPSDPPSETPEALALAVVENMEAHALGAFCTCDYQ